MSSLLLRIWAEPEAATQREQGHGGDLQRVSIVQDSQLIMPIIPQRSSACVNVQETPRVCSISLRIWAEPEDATQREQGHDG